MCGKKIETQEAFHFLPNIFANSSRQMRDAGHARGKALFIARLSRYPSHLRLPSVPPCPADQTAVVREGRMIVAADHRDCFAAIHCGGTLLSLPVDCNEPAVNPHVSCLFVREMHVSALQRVKMSSPEPHRSPEDVPVSQLHAGVRRWVSQAGGKHYP